MITLPLAPTFGLRISAATPLGESAVMREVVAAMEDVAFASTTVLLLGESGTGKEVFARQIHRLSPRAEGPWVAVNCAALPAELLESELFGHERGAFTGASDRRIGRIEQADKGTLLLDEISEMPLPLQAKLLRVLQEREVDRVGGVRPIPVDVRIIATSNRDLTDMVSKRLFRADLYYRLCVFPIILPPLRQRQEDIPLLAESILSDIATRVGRAAPRLSAEALACLMSYEFPGNVRELGNLLERALVRCRVPVLGIDHISEAMGSAGIVAVAPPSTVMDARPGVDSPPNGASGIKTTDAGDAARVAALPAELPLGLAELERLAIAEALRRVRGNRTHAARLLGISLRTLRNKLRAWRSEEGVSADGQNFPGSADPDDGSSPWSGGVARNSQEESTA